MDQWMNQGAFLMRRLDDLFAADWLEIERCPRFYSWAHLRKGENPATSWDTEPGSILQSLHNGGSFACGQEPSRYGELGDVMKWSLPVRINPIERRHARYAASAFD